MRGLSVMTVLTLLLSACAAPPGGGVSAGIPDAGNPAAPALSVSPQARTVVAGAGPIAFAATLSGGEGPITWTLTGPGTLDPSTGSATSYTPPPTVDVATTATLTATAGGALASGTVTVLPPSTTIEVAGRVIGMPGNPLPGMSVAIGDQTAMSDADGRFSISGVTPPYDLSIAAPGAPPVAGVYHGLTRPDPTLVFLFFVTPGEPNTGTVSGRVSGGDPIPSDGEFTGAVFASPEATGRITLAARDYTLPLSWFGPTTTIGTVHVLQWKGPALGLPPTSYTAFSSVTAVRVTDGQATADASVQLFDPGTASISGNVVAPAGSVVSSKALAVEFADHALLPLGQDFTPATPFTFAVPRNVTLTAVVSATAEFSNGAGVLRREAGIARGATDVAIVLPTPALTSAPADGTSDVTPSTDFRWIPFAGGVHVVIFNGTPTKPSYFVVTANSSTRIPDLPALGAALPAASLYSWVVVGLGPLASVDDYTGVGALIPPIGSLDESVSDLRTFTTR